MIREFKTWKKFRDVRREASTFEGPTVVEWIKEALNSGQYNYTSKNSIQFFRIQRGTSLYEKDEVQDVIETISIEVSWK